VKYFCTPYAVLPHTYFTVPGATLEYCTQRGTTAWVAAGVGEEDGGGGRRAMHTTNDHTSHATRSTVPALQPIQVHSVAKGMLGPHKVGCCEHMGRQRGTACVVGAGARSCASMKGVPNAAVSG
jgi:hypothetical protein